MADNQIVQVQQAQVNLPAANEWGENENYLNPARFDQIARLAKTFANTDLVPPHFKGKPENCFVALQMAFRSRIDPMVALQNLYLVQGKPGMSAQLAIALANRSGLLRGPISFKESGSGASYEVKAFATTRDGHEISSKASMKMAQAEGWTRNPKYGTMPEVMLRYRAATFLVRQHLPEVLLGMQTHEELVDVQSSKSVPQRTFNEDGAKVTAPQVDVSGDDGFEEPTAAEIEAAYKAAETKSDALAAKLGA